MVLRRRRRRSATGHRARVPPQSARRRFGSAVQRGAPGHRTRSARRWRPPLNSAHAASTSAGSMRRSIAVCATRVAASSVVAVGAWPRGGVAELERVPGGRPVGDRELRVDRRDDLARRWPCRSSPTRDPCPGRRTPAASAFATHRSASVRLWFIVVAPPENSTSTSTSEALAAASHIAMNRRFIDLVVGLVGAADHEPGPRPVRDDVRGRAALLDDPVDPAVGRQLLAPQADRDEQRDHRVERVPARSTGPTRRGRRSP